MRLSVFFALSLSVAVHAGEPPMKVGSGSYRSTAPKSCAPLPTKIYKTKDLAGPVVTNQWWSSLVWQEFSQNMFAHPAFTRCDADGVVVGYPGARVHGNQAGIFGTADLVKGDLKIGHSAVREFPQANCAAYSDWFVTAVMQTDVGSLTSSFGHGSPFVFGLITGGDPQVAFGTVPLVWGGEEGSAVMGVTVNGHHYGLFGSSGSRWEGLGTTTLTNVGRSGEHFTIAVLPDATSETLQLFAKYAHSHVTDTRVGYEVKGSEVVANYRFICTPREGVETDTVYALYPHQWKYSATELNELTYGSVRGVMKVGVGSGFKTSVPIQGVLPMLPEGGIVDRSAMVKLLKTESAKEKPDFADTYWEGKYLGTLASLSGIAEAANADEQQAVFVTEIKRRLESWLTATANDEDPVFYYDSKWGTLVGSPPSYGSDRHLNDHHFHYGYFIRAAAEVARHDPEWAKRWGPMVELLIRDIATPDRSDSLFPFLRCFDKYAGHSWASGDANFADGNNQESSSESLNAWYGLILWGEATGNRQVRDLGLSLFNIERTAVEEYWFDVSETNFPDDHPNVALGMVWGGKGAFATWFSAEIDCIHGINWLPFTPASIYMGRHPDYVKKNFARIVEKRTGSEDFNVGWGDLVVMFGALNDPASARRHLAENPDCKIEAGNSRAFMEHWTGALSQFGQIDASTVSSHPFTNVFRKKGMKTYAAYNFGSSDLSVEFSDGFVMQVAPHSMAVRSQE
ncbi:MAG: glycosyl hydrolase [Rubripirellula sp.]|nr:glycosyl hydrolase [Rubripirellula sp.]